MINSEEFSVRLQKLLDQYDETASSFAQKIGVQRSSISHILSGRNKPSLDFILKILRAYKNVDIYWLINGNSKSNSNNTAPSFDNAKENIKKYTDEIKKGDDIEQVIVFYKDGSFKSYHH